MDRAFSWEDSCTSTRGDFDGGRFEEEEESCGRFRSPPLDIAAKITKVRQAGGVKDVFDDLHCLFRRLNTTRYADVSFRQSI